MEQSWVEFYHAAVLETDWSKLEGEILAAEAAIKGRLHEFSLNHGGTPEENQAIVNAVNATGSECPGREYAGATLILIAVSKQI